MSRLSTTLAVALALAAPAAAFVAPVQPGVAAKSTALNAEMSKALPFLTKPVLLDGTLPGDAGFDPLGLSEIDDVGLDLYWMREAEIKHGRVAMLATVGFLFTEFCGPLPGWPLAEGRSQVDVFWDAVDEHPNVRRVGTNQIDFSTSMTFSRTCRPSSRRPCSSASSRSSRASRSPRAARRAPARPGAPRARDLRCVTPFLLCGPRAQRLWVQPARLQDHARDVAQGDQERPIGHVGRRGHDRAGHRHARAAHGQRRQDVVVKSLPTDQWASSCGWIVSVCLDDALPWTTTGLSRKKEGRTVGRDRQSRQDHHRESTTVVHRLCSHSLSSVWPCVSAA